LVALGNKRQEKRDVKKAADKAAKKKRDSPEELRRTGEWD